MPGDNSNPIDTPATHNDTRTHPSADGDTPNTNGTATYSPDDNKLRISPLSRLSAEDYQAAKQAGYRWAPMQKVFYTTWTPHAEDFAIKLCGEIEDDDKTLQQRAEERAERFEHYGENRTRDAEQAHAGVKAITSNIPLGQPILIGHHSERRARKDAERIENGMRKAVKLWDTADYWKERAAAALGHVLYSERMDVRARRIKGLESDLRKQLRIKQEAQGFAGQWQKVDDREKALALSNFDHVSKCFTLAEYPRELPKSQYEGYMSLWSALDGGIINHEQAREIALRVHARTVAWCERWITHYQNRLIYERAMLADQGGLVADKYDIQPGGRVLVRNEWLVVLRLNKKDDRLVSVTTNARYVNVIGIEQIKGYEPPTAEDAAKVKAVTTLGKLANYPGEGFVPMTQERYNRIPKDYKGTRTIAATATHGKHRVRRAIGVFALSGEKDDNKRHHYYDVYITDAKRVDPPAPCPAPTPAPSFEVRRELPDKPKTMAEPANEAREALREQLKCGVQVVSAPHLFPTPKGIADRMVELARPPLGARVLEPSAGTGACSPLCPACCRFPAYGRRLATSLRLSDPHNWPYSWSVRDWLMKCAARTFCNAMIWELLTSS